MLRFDDIFDYVPTNATILHATLFIDIDNPGDEVSLYRLADGVSNWTETTVTWNNLGSGTNGVDYAQTAVPAGENEQVTIEMLGPQGKAVQGFIRVSTGIR